MKIRNMNTKEREEHKETESTDTDKALASAGKVPDNEMKNPDDPATKGPLPENGEVKEAGRRTLGTASESKASDD